MVNTCSVRKPGSTESTRSRLLPSRPAPTSKTKAIASCPAMMILPIRWACALPVERVPNPSTCCASCDVARTALKRPKPTATSNTSPIAASNTGRLTDRSSRRGRLCGATAISA